MEYDVNDFIGVFDGVFEKEYCDDLINKFEFLSTMNKTQHRVDHGYDPLESYESKCEQYLMNDHGGVKLHLIVGVQKARMTRHYTLKAESITAGKVEMGQPTMTVYRGDAE